jgi:anti-sigma factor RsiW
MMSLDHLEQPDREQLSAYLDGELTEAESAAVETRIADDPAFATALDELRQLDGLLDNWTAPPLRRDLAKDILAEAHRRRRLPGWVQILAPLAAAAMILLAVGVAHFAGDASAPAPPVAGDPEAPPADAFAEQVDQVLAQVPAEDRLAVENLDLLANYEVLTSFETIEAMARIDQQREDLR